MSAADPLQKPVNSKSEHVQTYHTTGKSHAPALLRMKVLSNDLYSLMIVSTIKALLLQWDKNSGIINTLGKINPILPANLWSTNITPGSRSAGL
jgi:hypothetical protein